MEIENFKEKVELEKATEEPIFSEPHIINYYKMRLEVYLDGHGTGKGRYLSIHLQLLKGELDDCVSWPFTQSVILTVMHPKESKMDFYEILEYSEPDNNDDDYDLDYDNYGYNDTEELWNPDNNVIERIGYCDFISHQELLFEGYIKNDRFFIKCELT